MVLVDTSVWISHLRDGNQELANLLNHGDVLCHPLVVGELACGNLKDRSTLLSFFQALPGGVEADHEEALAFIESNGLMGKGLGYVDIHLAASAVLSGATLWTLDKKLAQAADDLQIKYNDFIPSP